MPGVPAKLLDLKGRHAKPQWLNLKCNM